MLNRKQIRTSADSGPSVTPICRIPVNGGEMNQWLAKQAPDVGVFRVVWPHVSTAEQADNAVAACRSPRLKTAPRYRPAGIRGDRPGTAARFWGLSQTEYCKRADVWPLDPPGEILVILMIKDTLAIENLDEILTKLPGIGAALIGEGDLSQELGYPREYEHPEVVRHMAEIVRICKACGAPVGHPHVGSKNVERVIGEGFDLLLAARERPQACRARLRREPQAHGPHRPPTSAGAVHAATLLLD
jgi:4-hydroxy-2-oxoheptanedioate aldolase